MQSRKAKARVCVWMWIWVCVCARVLSVMYAMACAHVRTVQMCVCMYAVCYYWKVIARLLSPILFCFTSDDSVSIVGCCIERKTKWKSRFQLIQPGSLPVHAIQIRKRDKRRARGFISDYALRCSRGMILCLFQCHEARLCYSTY